MIIHGDFETRSEVDLKEVGLDVRPASVNGCLVFWMGDRR